MSFLNLKSVTGMLSASTESEMIRQFRLQGKNAKSSSAVLIRKHLGISILLSGLSLASAYSATFYVSPGGADKNSGTASQAWKTLQRAFNTAVPGDTIFLLPGSYDGGTTKSAGSSSLPITIVGNGATITSTLTISHSSYVVTNLSFVVGRLNIYGVYASNNLITGCTFSKGNGGVFISDPVGSEATNGPAFNVIRGNRFSHPVGNGMVALTGHHNLVQSNLFENSDGWDAIRCFGSDQVIQDNVFNNIGSNPITGNHCDVIQSFGVNGAYAKNILFERNIVQNGDGQLCNLEAYDLVDHQRDWIFRNNLIANARGQANISIRGCKWYNNTFYRCPNPVLLNFGRPTTHGDGEEGEVFNNIFVECGTTPNNGFYGFNVALTNCHADYNFVADFEGRPKNMTVPEPHGINGGDIRFMDPANGNFRLRTSSPAVGRGKWIPNLIHDIESKDRTVKTKMDIGAYLFFGVGPAKPDNIHITEK